jgi:hypothetical protein
MSNVSNERFCPRITYRANWGPLDTSHHCDECGYLVSYEPRPGDGEVRLICIDCLVAFAPDRPPLEVHPDNNPWHCMECFIRLKR